MISSLPRLNLPPGGRLIRRVKIFFDLTMTQNCVTLLLTFTTVFPLAVVRYMVKPGVPPNAGLFFFHSSAWRSTAVAKPIRKKESPRRRATREEHLPLGRENFVILGIGLAVIIVGYLAMLEGSVEGFLPLVVAPILLVVGYCILIPLGIMYRKELTLPAAEARTEAPHEA
jgi:hypothetical protein